MSYPDGLLQIPYAGLEDIQRRASRIFVGFPSSRNHSSDVAQFDARTDQVGLA